MGNSQKMLNSQEIIADILLMLYVYCKMLFFNAFFLSQYTVKCYPFINILNSRFLSREHSKNLIWTLLIEMTSLINSVYLAYEHL